MSKLKIKFNSKNKKLLSLLITLLLLLLLIVIVGVAYAKFTVSSEGTISAQVARMICNMNVTACSDNDPSIINPYCIITVKNYAGASQSEPGQISQTDVKYTISVSPKKNQSGENTFELPEYYWYEISSPSAESGTRVGISTDLDSSLTSQGNIQKGTADTRYYKIVFLNSGESDVTRYVDFELNATQP